MANAPFNLNEAGEWAGLWWLPEAPNERVPGVLRYDGDGGLSLSLIGAFEDRVISTPAPGMVVLHEGVRRWEVVHGVAEQREITLLDCIATRSNRAPDARVKSPDKQSVLVVSAIIGAHVTGDEDSAFSAVEVSVEDLGLWAAESAFEGFLGAPNGKFDGSGRMSIKPIETRSVVVDDVEYRLAYTHWPPNFEQLKGLAIGRMRYSAFVRVVPKAGISLAAARATTSLVQDLISLATHRASGVIWLRLEVAGTASALPDGTPIPSRRADVLYSPSAIGKRDARALEQRRLLFTCASLPFEEVMPRWCDAYSRIQAATNMILGLRYAPATFVENNLLTAVGAAEALHRGLRIDEKPFTDADFKRMRQAMLEQVPEEHRERFRGSIRNDPTLRDRLNALASRPDQEAILLLLPDVAHWARRTTRARNDLAHEGRTPNHSIDELDAIVRVTSAVVLLNLMHELGLPAQRQREIVQEHPQLRATASAAREYLSDSNAGQ